MKTGIFFVRTKEPINGEMHYAHYFGGHEDDAMREFGNVYAADHNISIDEDNIIVERVMTLMPTIELTTPEEEVF